MRLIELSANKESFKTVSFKETGVSLVVAIRESDDSKKTYNSVGKSLLLYLVHFCLGASISKDFEEKLKDWQFSLKYKIDEAEFSVKRSVEDKNIVELNGESISLNSFKNRMAKLVFEIPSEAKFITFRSLIPRFLRGRKGSYVSYDRFIDEENKNPVGQLANNSFLLGLDVNRVIKKNALKDSFDKIETLKNNIQKDEVLKSFFETEDSEDFELRILDLESKIKRIKSNLEKFEIAEDYNNIKKEADELSFKLKGLRNQTTKIKNAINNIDKSLDIEPDISRSRLLNFYKKAQFELGDLVKRKLKDVESFNKKLLSNRTKRLLDDKLSFETQLAELSKKIRKLGKLENEKLKYLDTHGALDEFSQLNKQLGEYEKSLEKITNYQNLIEEYENQLEQINKEFSDENIATREYLKNNKAVLDKNVETFKGLTEQFYSEKIAGILIKNNDGKNKSRYDINAKIQDDAGDAVNEVKMFCFDWTILKNQFNHNIKFIFHDSRITDGMDTRQQATLLRIAQKETKENSFQYILSLNENVLQGLESEFSDEEFESIITENIILKLSDKSDEEKLLGIQVDLNYE
jgi:uncharacterized protein YydD (DUF2326 family)